MSLYIKDLNQITNMYKCKTTHTGSPYLVINKSKYLDLTTKSTLGTYLVVKSEGLTYRPLQTYTTTSSVTREATTTVGYTGYSSRVGSYTSTTGYSGVSSRGSTSGYSGTSTKASTSGYNGSLSKASTSGYNGSLSKASTSGYKGSLSKASTSGYSGKRWSAYTSATSYSGYTQIDTQTGQFFTKYGGGTYYAAGGWGRVNGNVTRGDAYNATNHTTAQETLINAYNVKSYLMTNSKTTTLWYVSPSYNNGSKWAQISNWVRRTSGYTTWSYAAPVYYSANRTSACTSTAVGALSSTTALTRSSAYSTTSTAVGNMSSTTARTKVSYYSTTSTAVGNMSSTGARTRASNYATSSTAVGNMSSTTALTRSSAYNATATGVGNMSSTTALTSSGTSVSQYLTSATSVGSVTTVINKTSSRASTSGYSGVATRASTSGYSGTSTRYSTSGYTGKSSISTVSSTRTVSTASRSGTSTGIASGTLASELYLLNTTSTSRTMSNSNYIALMAVKGTRTSKRANTTQSGALKGYQISYTRYEYTTAAGGWSNGTYSVSLPMTSSSVETQYGDHYWTESYLTCSATRTWEFDYGAGDNHVNTTSAIHTEKYDTYNACTFSVTVTKNYASVKYFSGNNGGYYWPQAYASSFATKTSNYTTYTESFGYTSYGTIESYHTNATSFTQALTPFKTGTGWETKSVSTTKYTSSGATNAGISSTTALTRTSAYGTSSSEAGAMSSVSALTRSSNYGTTSSTVGALMSTTALTRSSQYSWNETISAIMSSTTAITSKVSASSSSSMTIEA